MPSDAWLPLLLFIALLMALSLHGLAASGHFPREYRAPALRSGAGRLLLFGTMVVAIACLAVGGAVAWRQVPWYAIVIGGGAVILIAPLALHAMPDSFVNSAGALVVFGGASLLLTVVMAWLALAGWKA